MGSIAGAIGSVFGGPIGGAIGSAVGGMIEGDNASDTASQASNIQSQAADAQIAESKRQFNEIQKLLKPYVDVGTPALAGQQTLIGLNGKVPQQAALNDLYNSPQMTTAIKAGENAIRQNASATGGLRGGNIQAALAQFRPQLLSQMIDQQYSRLGGLATMGQNSAAGVGTAGQNSSNQIINALGQQGAAQAGGVLAQGQARANMFNGLSQAAGYAFGNNGLSSMFSSGSPTTSSYSDSSTPMFSKIGSDSFGFGATPQLPSSPLSLWGGS